MAHQFFSPSKELAMKDRYNFIYAVVVEWQTRYLEGVVGVYPWRFESSLPHTIRSPCESRGFFLFGGKCAIWWCGGFGLNCLRGSTVAAERSIPLGALIFFKGSCRLFLEEHLIEADRRIFLHIGE